jgi:molybdopterin-guanine dinucleotide biosynthesis protein A
MTILAAIILAGGRAERFQTTPDEWQDKALIKLYGKPLLIHAVESARQAVDEIIVCVNQKTRKNEYAETLKEHGITDTKILVDAPIDDFGGPIVGILTGLRNTDAQNCFTLPADMPLMQPNVIKQMFHSVEDAIAAVPMWPSGRLETLTMALRRQEALEIVETLCRLRRPRSDDIIRGALNVLLVSIVTEIRSLDPELKSFVNINFKTDLAELQPRRGEGKINKSLHLKIGSLPLHELRRLRDGVDLNDQDEFLKAANHFSLSASRLEAEQFWFWAALSRENEGKSLLRLLDLPSRFETGGKWAMLKAAENYELEAQSYKNVEAVFLAERAASDKAWCEKQARKH